MCWCMPAQLHISVCVLSLFCFVQSDSKLCMYIHQKLTADWNRTRKLIPHTDTQQPRLLHHFQTWISDIFLIRSTSEFTSKVKIFRLIGVTFSPLTIFDWEGGDKGGLLSFKKLHLFHHMYEHKGLIIYFYMQLVHNWNNKAELDNSRGFLSLHEALNKLDLRFAWMAIPLFWSYINKWEIINEYKWFHSLKCFKEFVRQWIHHW